MDLKIFGYISLISERYGFLNNFDTSRSDCPRKRDWVTKNKSIESLKNVKQTISLSEKEKKQINAVGAIFIHNWKEGMNKLSGSEQPRKQPEEQNEEVNDDANNGYYECRSLKPFRPCGAALYYYWSIF